MSTPHNNAKPGDIAKIVLMPGDPLRAKAIADKYLENPICFNTVRNMFGFTGLYKGHRVTVMGSGMGMPSLSIYAYELYSFYDVDTIIRIGSAGSYDENINLFDIVLANDAYSESSFAKTFSGQDMDDVMPASPDVNLTISDVAFKKGLNIIKGRIHSSDVFYHMEESQYMDKVEKNNCLCVEMESYALFTIAKVLKKKAACLLTISDSLVTHQVTTAEERQNSFNQMIELALDSTLALK